MVDESLFRPLFIVLRENSCNGKLPSRSYFLQRQCIVDPRKWYACSLPWVAISTRTATAHFFFVWDQFGAATNLWGINAFVPPVSECDKISITANWGGTSENRQAHWTYPAFAYWDLRWMQEKQRVCHLYGGVPCRRLSPLPAVHAHISCGLHWRLADEEFHLSFVHGACWVCPPLHLWSYLNIYQRFRQLHAMLDGQDSVIISCSADPSKQERAINIKFSPRGVVNLWERWRVSALDCVCDTVALTDY